QRCSGARRLIVPADGSGDELLERLVDMTRDVRVGDFRQRPEPFTGPVISDGAAKRLLAAKDDLLARGADELLEMKPTGARPALLRPGILDVTAVPDRPDEELFGPLLQVIRISDFDAAIDEANNTRFGL